MKTITRGLFYFLTYSCVIMLFINCRSEKKENETQVVEVKNELDFSRNEVVAIKKEDLAGFLEKKAEENLRIKKESEDNYLHTQWIDNDLDGVMDELLFQAKVEGNSSVKYIIVEDSSRKAPESDVVAYSRFVPERIDDYTWENDKVAFRTYGPEAKTAALEGIPGGVISSGIDLWLKSTDKSIIDEWYQKNTEEEGYYHIDRGDGYDPYHVGSSRGTGGIGVWKNDSLYVSENFVDYKTIADGPLRTVFELTYAPWSPYNISETKRITLDLGSNFSKFESDLSSAQKVPNYTIGITLHEKEGEVKINEKNGWFLHWEPIKGSRVGEGILITPKVVDSAFSHKSEIRDRSHLLIVTEPTEKLIYYAGFAWEKSGQISNLKDWEEMLDHQSQIINKPLEVILK
ncbi:DUF4861 family protein [Gramella sp. AN32]|uniref:DUF4861 family protein n=1 Tax=Christiangramia antarctica TaxID=2058158 RepID=A0ABW5X273_9FLAO|nr:DUF4861 family protein [Gramella sp. AN32]MCM4157055.1 DUF4861 domain-containing protein [Gramella sp. AN32]